MNRVKCLSYRKCPRPVSASFFLRRRTIQWLPCGFISGLSILFHWSIFLSLCQYHKVSEYQKYRRRQWHPTPVLLPGKSHRQRSLVGCSPWGREELGTTEWLYFPFSLSCIGEGNGTPLQCSCLEDPRDGGDWWAAVYGVAQSLTRLKWLSSSSSRLVLPVYGFYGNRTIQDVLFWVFPPSTLCCV